MLRLPRKDHESIRGLAKDTAGVFAGIGAEYRMAALVLFVQEAGNELHGFDEAFAEMVKDTVASVQPAKRPFPKPSVN